MEGKNFDFAHTNQALAELSDALTRLTAAFEAKKSEVKIRSEQQAALVQDREKRLAVLEDASHSVMQNIDGIINRLDKVLQEDGSGNNHN